MTVHIRDSQRLIKTDKKSIKRIIQDLLIYLGLKHRGLSLFFVSNNQIKRINKRWFSRAASTNVISFSYLSHDDTQCPIPNVIEGVIGDIVISLEKAKEESEIVQCPFYERLFALIIHGIVHILGYDHESDKHQARRMRYKEKRLMSYITSHICYKRLLEREKGASSLNPAG